MLTLTCCLQQSIRIGHQGEIRITVLDNRYGRTLLGIDAPRDIPIDREEIFLLKQAEREYEIKLKTKK